MDTFYITTAIDYVNAKPHIGHAYEKILADVLARWNRIKNKDVFFLTGTDDNAQKNAQAAKEKNKDIKEFVDENAKYYKELCKQFNISNDYFIRTTEKRHKEISKKIFEAAFKKGDIYKGKYEGYYCIGCESFLTEKDLIDGKCPEHNKEPEWKEEESYFFKLSKYREQLLKLISSKDFIIPKEKRNEMVSRLKSEELKDLSVSRPTEEWGIPTPIDKEHVIYVWYDALINYISAIDYPDKNFKKYWPANFHVIGKGINWFHSIIWPAILISEKIAPPKHIAVHGYLTVNGQKISKSLGNAIDPLELSKKFQVDSLRYFLLREIPFGQDGDFSEKALVTRHNNELANDLGNLISRVLTLTEKNFESGISSIEIDEKLSSKLNLENIDHLMENFELNNALSEIWKFINECNKYINENKIWELKEEKLQKSLYTLLESIRIISILLSSFIPETSEKINQQLNIKQGKIKDCKFNLIKNYKVKKSGVLFKKIEEKQETSKEDPFTKLDLRVAEIKEVKNHPNADKLYVLKLNVGDKDVQIVSGLKDYYKENELLNKKIIIIYNLENSIIRGVESNAMLLAVENNQGKLSLLTVKDSSPGDKVYTTSKEKEAEEVKFNDFKKLKIITKNNKIYYEEHPLKTDKEEITLDKEMEDNLRVE